MNKTVRLELRLTQKSKESLNQRAKELDLKVSRAGSDAIDFANSGGIEKLTKLDELCSSFFFKETITLEEFSLGYRKL